MILSLILIIVIGLCGFGYLWFNFWIFRDIIRMIKEVNDLEFNDLDYLNYRLDYEL